MTGPFDWWRGGGLSQHLLAVGFPVPGGSLLESLGVLLHFSQLVGYGLDDGCLAVSWRGVNRGLHTSVPGSGMVRALWWVGLILGCVWGCWAAVTLVGCLATPSSSSGTASPSLGWGWWRQIGSPPGPAGSPPGGGLFVGREGALLVQWCWMAAFAVRAVLKNHD